MRSILIALSVFYSLLSFSQSEELRKQHFNIKKSVALEGYDPVSYFSNAPKKGSTEFSYTYQGVQYLFSTKGNLDKFKTSPASYEPQYGGWCAYAIGETSEKVKIDPKTFKITDGKLYLFYNFYGTNTLDLWNQNEATLFKKAEANWPKLIL